MAKKTITKKKIDLKEALEIMQGLCGSLSEREAARKVSGEYQVMFQTYGGFEKEYTEHTLRKKYIEHKMGKLKNSPFENRPIEEKVAEDMVALRQKAKEKELKAKYEALLRINEELQERYDAALRITERVDFPTIVSSQKKGKDKSTAIVCFSDWHIEERVDASTINGINEYNPTIAKQRAENVVANSLKLINKEREHSDVDTLVLWLGGDFITGYIHPELEESNYLSPIEAIMEVKKMLLSAIQFYLTEGNFKRIVVPCNVGNHGRTMQKPRVSTGNRNSYEYMMYHDLKNTFSGDTDFMIPDGMYTYVSIYDKLFRFAHGDHIKFGGGIGGLTVPLTKAIMRADTQTKAYYNIIGHYHQFWEATSNCLVNGSLIGYGAYAQRIGATPEPPQQALRIMDSKRGLTAKFPIFCD